jgi:tetratricopeptide (TPR) repeat protein
MRAFVHFSFVTTIVLAAASSAAESPRAPLFEGMGKVTVPVSTKSKQAQRYFDQGLALAFAFNHAEAARSFREVTQLDPNCAMGWWGAALVLGPNINAPMDTALVAEAFQSVQNALALAKNPKGATDWERAMIDALAQRYAMPAPEDRKPLDVAYANAMREVVKRFPKDDLAAALLAESLMDVTPWNYYDENRKPHPWTAEIVSTLEAVLERNPDHPLAIHLYIHATEASTTPERAEPYADRLGALMPGAGHMVHMPSHTYIRTGRYHDVVLVNLKAGDVDKRYVEQCHAQGLYPLGYIPHNHHMAWAGACMLGWSAAAFDAATRTYATTAHDMMRDPGMGTLQHYSYIPLYGLVRFGKWDEILAMPAPAADLLYPTGLWHYARGRAYLAKGQLDNAAAELEQLSAIAARDTLEKVTIWEINNTKHLMAIGVEVLSGEWEAKRGNVDAAVKHLNEGVKLESQLAYNEPVDWIYPVRHSLGAVLLEAGRAAEAEKVYLDDLKENPENGWALMGLMKSCEAQGKAKEAADAKTRFEKAWKAADIQIAASRL